MSLNKCWMTSNLELGEYGTPMNLTDQLSNVGPDGYTLILPFANSSVYKGNSNHYGNYYNWDIATAGSGTSTAGEDAPYSICPKNWRLPSAGNTDATNSEFYIMLNNYITTGAWNTEYNRWEGVTTSQVTTEPISLLFSGLVQADGTLYDHNYGLWWSSTSSGSSGVFNLAISIYGNAGPKDHDGYTNNYSLRCLVNQ